MQGMGSAHGFWELLTGDEQRDLMALGRDKKYPPGTTLCVEGDPATHVFVLLDGWVKILSVTDDGHENVLALLGGGDIAGETAGATTGYRNATMQAIGTVHALIVGYDGFSSFLDSHAGADHVYRRMMTQRWSDAGIVLRTRAVTSGAQRLAGLLLDLAGQHGSRSRRRYRGRAAAVAGRTGEHDRHVSCYRHPRAQQLAEARLHPYWPVPHHHHRPAGPPAGRGSGHRADTTICCDESTE